MIEILMSRNAAQLGVKPDGRCNGSGTAALRASRTTFDIFLAKEVVPEADRVELSLLLGHLARKVIRQKARFGAAELSSFILKPYEAEHASLFVPVPA